MKRLPVISGLIAFALLCMTLSFWGLKFFKVQSRGVAAPVQQSTLEPGSGQWGGIFGDSALPQAAISNHQLKGVVLARRANESAAVISTDGKPGRAVGIGAELAPGVVLKEVYAQYILISDNGALKRLELPQSAVIQLAATPPVAAYATPAAPENPNPSPVAPAGFPPHGAPANVPPGGAPMVVPGLPVASLPAVMPTGAPQ
ncbi:type II secretion system protein N [Undibacterium curvum]|jgi:general secretion pathway protein C|uniref:Type II secretion system protein GspC N-terminal domain-containing protein n=1 Tax=Undibacterium curvum TaxID=2762294 RepID=A0ABR7A7I8_9BURK|nr:type II secretion system protein N [Undibacterium curvum]MBC3932773.1 hypothetical protein [Undibacterium curvum]